MERTEMSEYPSIPPTQFGMTGPAAVTKSSWSTQPHMSAAGGQLQSFGDKVTQKPLKSALKKVQPSTPMKKLQPSITLKKLELSAAPKQPQPPSPYSSANQPQPSGSNNVKQQSPVFTFISSLKSPQSSAYSSVKQLQASGNRNLRQQQISSFFSVNQQQQSVGSNSAKQPQTTPTNTGTMRVPQQAFNFVKFPQISSNTVVEQPKTSVNRTVHPLASNNNNSVEQPPVVDSSSVHQQPPAFNHDSVEQERGDSGAQLPPQSSIQNTVQQIQKYSSRDRNEPPPAFKRQFSFSINTPMLGTSGGEKQKPSAGSGSVVDQSTPRRPAFKPPLVMDGNVQPLSSADLSEEDDGVPKFMGKRKLFSETNAPQIF